MLTIDQKLWRVYFKYNRTGLYKNNIRIERRSQRINTARYLELKKYFQSLYDEYGIKHIANKHNLTYTNMRQLLKFFGVEIRKGMNVVIPSLCESRRQKALSEHKAGIGWFDPEIRRKIEKTNARGVQGYYLNQSTNELVWLRSTYEYIFAKWLDRTKHNWKMEMTYYKLGTSIYRPDFFIHDENWNLVKIIEIKGYWDSNVNKALLLNEQLKNIDVVIITDIEQFIEGNGLY